MASAEMIIESLKFMVLGMSVVFTFLVILIIVVNIQAKLIAKFFKEEEVIPDILPTVDDAHHVAAIVAAVKEFRKL